MKANEIRFIMDSANFAKSKVWVSENYDFIKCVDEEIKKCASNGGGCVVFGELYPEGYLHFSNQYLMNYKLLTHDMFSCYYRSLGYVVKNYISTSPFRYVEIHWSRKTLN